MERYLKNFETCLEKEIPYCEAECPFHMEVFNFMEKAARGANKAAFKIYRNAVGYPRIANILCHEPCKNICPRKDFGGAVEMGLLEKGVMEHAGDTSATDYNIPMKKERVAIVGAGISGMAALLRLSTKKYHVEVFEKTDRLGGHLWDLMDSKVFLSDFEEQLAHQDYVVHFNREIASREELEKMAVELEFDAIYVATGQGGADFGLMTEIGELGDPYCRKIGKTGYFAGGGVIGEQPIYALAKGLAIGTVLDNYLKTGYLYYPENLKPTALCPGMVEIQEEQLAVVPKQGNGYTKEELLVEASRCVRCQCSFCSKHCDLVAFTDKWPARMRDEIVATTLEGKSELKATPAKRLMSLCNQCGICKEVCPQSIDLDGLFMAGRKKMHRQGKFPWAFHEFFLQDMDFSNSEYASLVMGSGGQTGGTVVGKNCRYAFFPGCQLGASEPELVKRTYGYLASQGEDMGMMLMCCGVPAEWSGDEKRHEAELERIRGAWKELGEPTLLLACPTCFKKFQEHLPEIPIISLYEKLAEKGADLGTFGRGIGKRAGTQYRIFDACSSRGADSLQLAVRELVKGMGISPWPSEDGTTLPQCCGFGGHGEIANPKYTQFVTDKRVAESQLPYITYCINCRDNFKEAGKETFHLLEALFYDEEELQAVMAKKLPTVTERRDNRVNLKQGLLKEFWSGEMDKTLLDDRKYAVKMRMSDETAEKFSKERILLEDVAATIAFCERTRRTVYNEADDTYSGYQEIGFMTLWVQYRKANSDQEEYQVVNAYSHRMKIELEAVWNGKKCEIDVQQM